MVTSLVEKVFCNYCRAPTFGEDIHPECRKEFNEYNHDSKTCELGNVYINLYYKDGFPTLFKKHRCEIEQDEYFKVNDITIVSFGDRINTSYHKDIKIKAKVANWKGEIFWIDIKFVHNFMSWWDIHAFKIEISQFECQFCLCRDQDKCCTPVSGEYEVQSCACYERREIEYCNC